MLYFEKASSYGIPFSVIHAPAMIDAFINRLFGHIYSRRIFRWFNKKILAILIERISPNVIFYGDAFLCFSPIKKKGITLYTDLQDDFDWDNPKYLEDDARHASYCFAQCDRVYGVSPVVCERYSRHYNVSSYG